MDIKIRGVTYHNVKRLGPSPKYPAVTIYENEEGKRASVVETGEGMDDSRLFVGCSGFISASTIKVRHGTLPSERRAMGPRSHGPRSTKMFYLDHSRDGPLAFGSQEEMNDYVEVNGR